MRKAQIGFFERDALIEELARKFYQLQGCELPAGLRMQDQTHPMERYCVACAVTAINRLARELK